MKNHVSPETARKLKEAGLSQPKFEVGQFWYKERYPGGTAAKQVLCVFSELDFIPLDGGNYPTGEAVFAPTITDIMPHLDGYKFLSVWSTVQGVEFRFAHKEYTRRSGNPSEDAAHAFLKYRNAL